MKNNNYITIQGWMVNELNLKGNELIVYAIIYMFSQTENQKFAGSLKYLSEWCNSSKESMRKVINSLVEKKLIEKKSFKENNLTYCEYHTTKLDKVYNKVDESMQQSCINNKNIKNIKENIKRKFDMFWSLYPRKVSKGTAEKWFEKNNPSDELLNIMIEKIKLLKTTEQWKSDNGKYIPYPSTWLNAKGWEDEVNVSLKQKQEKRIF